MNILPHIQDEVGLFVLNDLEQGKAISREAALYGFFPFPVERDTFLKLAPWLIVAPEQICFHCERAEVTPDKGETYSGPLLVMFDPSLYRPDEIEQILNVAGKILLLGDVLDRLAKEAN